MSVEVFFLLFHSTRSKDTLTVKNLSMRSMKTRLGSACALLPVNENAMLSVGRCQAREKKRAQLVDRRDEWKCKANCEEGTDFGAEGELLVAWPCERKVLEENEHGEEGSADIID